MSPYFVLTAAHCFTIDDKASWITVDLGESGHQGSWGREWELRCLGSLQGELGLGVAVGGLGARIPGFSGDRESPRHVGSGVGVGDRGLGAQMPGFPVLGGKG